MDKMPPRWLVGLLCVACAAIAAVTGYVRLSFEPTQEAALTELSGPVVGWERKTVGEGPEFDLWLELEGQAKKIRFSSEDRAFGTGFDALEQEVPPGTPLTVKVARSYAEGDFPATSGYALRSADKEYLTLAQSQDAERDNNAAAGTLSAAFGAGAAVMLLLFVYIGRLAPAGGGSGEPDAAAVAAAVSRLAGKGEPATDRDFEVLCSGWLTVPSMDPVVAPGKPFRMPSTTNGAGDKIAFLFSHPAAFVAWGQAPHSVEMPGLDAFKLVLANGFQGAAIDVAGPEMLGLTRGVLEDLVG
ncbi:MAG: hypothetical protein HYV15_08080 [Elusimicrobia bacterium]|nr:hypothetical protein [Elusimicrobiota bacterium]